jgi:ribosomal protein S13
MTDLQVTVEGELRSEVAMNIKRLRMLEVIVVYGIVRVCCEWQERKRMHYRKGKKRTVGMGTQVVGKKDN